MYSKKQTLFPPPFPNLKRQLLSQSTHAPLHPEFELFEQHNKTLLFTWVSQYIESMRCPKNFCVTSQQNSHLCKGFCAPVWNFKYMFITSVYVLLRYGMYVCTSCQIRQLFRLARSVVDMMTAISAAYCGETTMTSVFSEILALGKQAFSTSTHGIFIDMVLNSFT